MIAQGPARLGSAACRIAPLLRRSLRWLAPLALASLAACGGGDPPSSAFGSSSSSSSSAGGDGWVAGVYPPESQYQARCQNPRTGTDPYDNNQPYPDVQGTTLDENFWLRSWTNDLYLWYDEVPDIDPGTYTSATAYFAVLKTSAMDALGDPKDKFHFTMPTSQWEQFSQSGVDIGYGLTWSLVSASPPREIYAGYVWPGYSAATAGIARGWEVMQIDGVDMINADDAASLSTLNEGLSPTAAGETHQFTFLNPATNAQVTVTLQAAQVNEMPVPVVTTLSPSTAPGKVVGYILFDDVIATSEQELITAITQLQSANVTDLILDLRYNGGGFLDIASELDYMIAGPGPTAGAYFERIAFNAKHPTTNPVTGQPIMPTPFHTTTQGFSTTSGTALPYLSLSRVFVLTGPDTCSASEAIMNGLVGVGVQVIQIGSTTCGKPYGFYPQDNCGTTYFAIEFQGNNFAGFGNYPDGFTPQNSSIASQLDPQAVLPGCSVADDFGHALGDANEGRTAAALAYAAGGSASCPAPSGLAPAPTVHSLERSLAVHRAPWHTMRILRRPPPR
jgi:carboxyl-terminal processing protease